MKYWNASPISWSRKPQHPIAAFDQRHPHAERRHDAGVLGADDAAADDDHRLGQRVEVQRSRRW